MATKTKAIFRAPMIIDHGYMALYKYHIIIIIIIIIFSL